MSDEPCWCSKPVTLQIDASTLTEIARAERLIEEMKRHRCPQANLVYIDGQDIAYRMTVKTKKNKRKAKGDGR